MDYIDLILKELKEKRAIAGSANKKTWSTAFVSSYTAVRSVCEKEVLALRESNLELSKYVEKFSGAVLSSIAEAKRKEEEESLISEAKLDIVNELIDKFDAIQSSEKKEDTIKTREERGIRNVGERPKTIKEKREEVE